MSGSLNITSATADPALLDLPGSSPSTPGRTRTSRPFPRASRATSSGSHT